VIPAGEPGDVTGLADDDGGYDRANPEDLGRGGPGRRDRGREALPGVAHLLVDAAQVRGELAGEVAAGSCHRAIGLQLIEQPAGPSCGDLAGEPAGDQRAQHGMQPAGDLGPGAAQIAVAPGPDPHHRRVIFGADLSDRRRAQRGDGDRAGVVRVVLVRRPGGEQPYPGRELGLHVGHLLAGRYQLLRQQIPQAAGALDGPDALGPSRRPAEQPAELARAGADTQLAECGLGLVDR